MGAWLPSVLAGHKFGNSGKFKLPPLSWQDDTNESLKLNIKSTEFDRQ